MTSCTPDIFWNGASIGCGAALTPWLHDRGSLTRRIQQRCEKFAVQPVCSGLARIAQDESALLGLAPQQLAYSREVFLHADGKPVVFAHSTCAPQHLRGPWAALGGLGNQPLGAMLFAHPLVRRGPLRFKPLHETHSLYRRAASALNAPPPPPPAGKEGNVSLRELPNMLWARRSLFTLHDAPLLVTEVFLPGILSLKE